MKKLQNTPLIALAALCLILGACAHTTDVASTAQQWARERFGIGNASEWARIRAASGGGNWAGKEVTPDGAMFALPLGT